MELNLQNHCQVDSFAKPREIAAQVNQSLALQQEAKRQTCIESVFQRALQSQSVENDSPAVSVNVPSPYVPSGNLCTLCWIITTPDRDLSHSTVSAPTVTSQNSPNQALVVEGLEVGFTHTPILAKSDHGNG